MGELALIEPSAINVASELPGIFRLASALKDARGFLPPHLQTEGQIVAVIMAGRELGIPPMAAIRGINLVQGRVVIDAALQLGLMARAGAKWSWVKDGSDGEAVLHIERPGHPAYESRFNINMAKDAGLLGKDNWHKHPAAMLRARCVTAAGKAYMPDVLSGVYLPDELDDSHYEPPARTTLVERVEAVQAQDAHEVPALPAVPSAELAAEALAALAGARTTVELAAIEDGIRGEWPKYGRTDRAKLKAAQVAARKRVESTNAEWGMGEQLADAPAEGE